MSNMTDERAAEVLAAHNQWRRYNGETGEPGAPAMGGVKEIGHAIDHAVSRLRSQPPAEAQAVEWPEGLLDRVKEAERRMEAGHAPRRIPANASDVDLLLAEIRALLEGHNPPFWLKPLTLAPPSAPKKIADAVEFMESEGWQWDGSVWHRDSPPSAPVGVEAIKSAIAELDALRNAMFKTYAAAANGADKTKLIRLIEAERDAYEAHYSLPKLQEALAQQPAGVDEAMVERARKARLRYFSTLPAPALENPTVEQSRESMCAALTAALAAQQGGSDNDR